MNRYAGWGNEKLLPLAVGGNVGALKELKERGNALTEDGEVTKTVTGASLLLGGFRMWNDNPILRGDVCVIVNGKVISVNGES